MTNASNEEKVGYIRYLLEVISTYNSEAQRNNSQEVKK
jgi:hypothetical protein